MGREPRQATVELEHRQERRATEVLERLRRVRADGGMVGPAEIDRIARELGLPRAHVRGAASFYADLALEPAPRTVRLCDGTACLAATGGAHLEPIRAALAAAAPEARTCSVACLGYCYASPSALDGELAHAGSDLAEQLVARAPRRDPPVPFGVSVAEPIVLSRLVGEGPPAWSAYDRLASDPDGPRLVLDAVERSGLQGRGGAGFPTARKWALVRDAPGSERRVVANGDEGDPGSYADRLLMERDPHGVLEGVALAALACGAERGYVYVRSEYPAARDALRAAVTEAREAGRLGPRADGSRGLEIEIFEGAGSYLAGEETALLHSMEGLRGGAAARPPYPVGHGGLYGIPTAVNNIETLATIAWIVTHGGDAFAARGTARSHGTKLVSLNERFSRPGVYEVELGMPIARICSELGGGLASGSLRALEVGGPLGGWLAPDELDTPLSPEGLAAHGLGIGHGSLVAFDGSVDGMTVLRRLWRFAAEESCGSCSPCRVGSRRGLELAGRATAASPRRSDGPELEQLLHTLATASLCGFGQALPAAVRSLMRVYGLGGGP